MKHNTIVLIVIHTFALSVVGYGLKLSEHVILDVRNQHVAEICTISILDSNSVNIGKIEEEVLMVEVLRFDAEYFANLIDVLACFELRFDPSIVRLDLVGAVFA